MDYYYEALNEQSFQKLAQALIVAQHPGIQCLPVGQPDGGRDAFFLHPEPDKSGFITFQVKYSRNPNSKDERDVILEAIKSEKDKVEKLIRRGATQYFLITNVQGTSHLDRGSIDKGNTVLGEAFGIPSQVWWRDDLDRRLDNSFDIRWRYPQLLSVSDLLPLLMKKLDDPKRLQSARTLKSYVAAQYRIDREIRFKQVELNRALIDLFVDLPIGKKRLQDEGDRKRRLFRSDTTGDFDSYLAQLDVEDDFDSEDRRPLRYYKLAGSFFLRMPLTEGVSRFVLEGAPGQGKSTVTQFLCQVNRLRLLGKEQDLRGVADDYKSGLARLPFRADLRDYAAWVAGRHPFPQEGEASVPEEGRRSLESFLAMQVTLQSGSQAINEDDLLQIFERSHSVIVLDGFDEVADIATRTRLVEEICKASTRLDAHARSLQIVVTSRPAAFANSAGFPENDWVHLELRDLRRGNIEAYKDKWIAAKRLNVREGEVVSSTLEDKLEQPHLRDLARNPMQLSILLHLIHVLGAALPEKRTTLYEEYMMLFFNREAEKSSIVQEHRELLLTIHGLMAWVLHTQAEEGSGSGSITKDKLQHQIRDFLEVEEYDPNLADELLRGTSERVGALVSRVQGTFEFEVQPLREYFAARHLYKRASYSPPGKPQKGTRPDRFHALAQSFYWTNVTRFFCGFYDFGELGTLLDDLMQLGTKQKGYDLINHPRRLAMMLLSDHVFAQSPRFMRLLIHYVCEEPGFQRFTPPNAPQRSLGMALPASAGRDMLFDVCQRRLNDESDPSRRRILREIMAENADWNSLKTLWKERLEKGLMRSDPLMEAMDLRIIGRFNSEEIETLTEGNTNFRLRWFMRTGQYEKIIADCTLYGLAKAAFFDGQTPIIGRDRFNDRPLIQLEVLIELLRVRGLANLFSESSADDAFDAIMERRYGFGWSPFEQGDSEYKFDDSDPLTAFVTFTVDLLKNPVGSWQKEIWLWNDLVNKGFELAPGGWLFGLIAAVSTAVQSDAELAWHPDGFALTKGLVGRLHFARRKAGDVVWWRRQLKENAAGHNSVLCLSILMCWGEPDVLVSLRSMIGRMVDELDQGDWSRLWFCFTCITAAASDRRPELKEDCFGEVGTQSARLALAMIDRVSDNNLQKCLSRQAFGTYQGNNRQVIRYAANCELEHSKPDGIDWSYICHLSRLGKKSGLSALFSMRYFHLWQFVPDDIATTVLKECESHDGQLVALCEHAFAMSIAKSADKVSEIADRDAWFAPYPA